MLTIEYKEGTEYRRIIWHVGESLNLSAIAWNSDITWLAIQADGDELGKIYWTTRVETLHKSVVSWFGDTARYILANL